MDRNKQVRDVASITNGGASAFEEDNERMDIIGHNGNDGLHYELEEPDVEPREENDPQRPTLKGGIKT